MEVTFVLLNNRETANIWNQRMKFLRRLLAFTKWDHQRYRDVKERLRVKYICLLEEFRGFQEN
jgi:hypothetical protein